MNEVKKVFYLCDGEVPECGKSICYKNEISKEGYCKHTTNIGHAINFEDRKGTGIYYELEGHKKNVKKSIEKRIIKLSNILPAIALVTLLIALAIQVTCIVTVLQ